MPILRTVRVAALQATPVILDGAGDRREGVRLIAQAADAGAELAVLPETFVSLYPSNAWAQGRGILRRLRRALGAHVAELYRRPRPARRRARGRVCAGTPSISSIGVNERESERPGTLYNTLLLARARTG